MRNEVQITAGLAPQRRAVFLDRDGVLNRNVFYADTGAWESPRTPAEFALCPDVLPALARLSGAGFLLFVVSNQPNEAKGKSRPGTLASMHRKLVALLASAGLELADAFYCTHHPDFPQAGVAPGRDGGCVCRKPEPYFLLEAARAHNLALRECWMIGDRATDMACGRAAGVRTAWVDTRQERIAPDPAQVDVGSMGLADAVQQILSAVRERV
ncbi:HAD-IIIA family hydrolase [Acidipila sp. EB88]|uniref:D-glycero-alpha-D-manno-heptose-1,7-bisphosphate 7-phosphatase n=1 Tax=Acidipila sp. EB88 TaxID=2305226 RepID=UPI001315AAFD|nr:HAD-IIIA family hydrolase [Acidipila sp. EB88]